MFEVYLRLLILVPLFFTAYQAIMLRRVLESPSWSFIASGFTILAASMVLILAGVDNTPVRLVFWVGGLSAIAVGFHLLNRDIRLVLSPSRARERAGRR